MSDISFDYVSGKTPISKLNEMMQKRLLPLPTYDEGLGKNGPPFIIFCRIKDLNLVTEVLYLKLNIYLFTNEKYFDLYNIILHAI